MPTDLDNTAAEALGLTGIARVAQNASPIVGSGSVSPLQRRTLDTRLLDDTVAILEKYNRARILVDAERGRRAGQQVIGTIGQLDPAAPDYLQQRNKILAQNPMAVLDDTAVRFLGLQEDMFELAEGKRQTLESRGYEEGRYRDRLDDQVEIQKRAQAERERQEMENNIATFSPGAQLIYQDGLSKEKTQKEAFVDAARFEEDLSLELQLLETGVPQAQIDEFRDSETRMIDRRKVANYIGQSAQQEAFKKQQLEKARFIEDEIDALQETLRGDRYDEMPPEQKAKITNEIASLRLQLRQLRNIQLSDKVQLTGEGPGQGAPDPLPGMTF